MAAAPSVRYELQKYARRHRRGLAAAGAIVLALIAGTVVSLWQAVRATNEKKIARAERGKAVLERDRARKAEQEAKDERTVSDAVRNFLQQGLLAQASPESAPEPDLKLRTVLDRASEKIEGRFANQPLVEAGIRMTLTKTYHALGAYGAMVHHGERALELYRQRLGDTNPLTLTAMSDLGDAYRHLGEVTKAIPLLRQMLDLRQQVLGPNDPSTLDGMSALALAYRDAHRLPEALELSEQALKLMKATLGPDHRATLACANGLATIYGDVGRLADALSLSEETFKLMKATLGPEHPDTLVSMNNLAAAYVDADRTAEALPLYEEVFKIMKARLGADHPNTLKIMNNLAFRYRIQGNVEQAKALSREVIAIGRKRAAAGPAAEPSQLATALHQLADVLRAEDILPEAHALAEESVTLYQRHPGWSQHDASHAFEVLAFVQKAEGDWAGAEKSWRETLRIRTQFEPDHWRVFDTQSLLGSVLFRQNKFAEAEPFLLSGYEGLRKREAQIPASDKGWIRDALFRLPRHYEAWDKVQPNTGKAAQAAEWKQKLDEFDKAVENHNGKRPE